MYARQVNENKLQTFHENLNTHARHDPMDTVWHCTLQVNDFRYHLQLLVRGGKVGTIQATRTSATTISKNISSPAMLTALTELLTDIYSIPPHPEP